MKLKKTIAHIIKIMPVVAWLVFMHYITVEKDLPTGQWACGLLFSLFVMIVTLCVLEIFFIDTGFAN